MAKTATKIKLVICDVTTKAEKLIWDAIEGKEVLRRARRKILGARDKHCKLVLEGKIRIPRRWRKYDLLIFPQLWQNRDFEFADCLQWSSSGWRLVHHNMDCTLYGVANIRVVGVRKK